MIDLSVLICSTHTRWDTFGQAIQKQIWPQLAALPEPDQQRIEIVMLTDNKTMMLGHKRNILVDLAQGRYVTFVDDDDRIEGDYLATLLAATSSDADVITYRVSVSLNGRFPKLCVFSKDFRADRNLNERYERLPNHLCVVKRDIAAQVSFPNLAYGEDSAYSKLLHPLLKTEHAIDRVLYHYDYALATTEAQQHLRAPIRTRPHVPAVVDVVIMSKAPTQQLRQMTQRTINSCISGANSLPLNVLVLEQAPGHSYTHARTMLMGEPFNYNRFANRGAQLGQADWLLIANNDLTFHDGWLHHLLAADHPVVSPKNPLDYRQQHVTENTTGYENAANFSGWCFLIKRDLWRRIGGFDDCVKFWCSDDAILEQLRVIDVAPMLVPAARVTHHVSASLYLESDRDDLTWGQVVIFNEKYGRDKFAGDPRFAEYKRRTTNLPA